MWPVFSNDAMIGTEVFSPPRGTLEVENIERPEGVVCGGGSRDAVNAIIKSPLMNTAERNNVIAGGRGKHFQTTRRVRFPCRAQATRPRTK